MLMMVGVMSVRVDIPIGVAMIMGVAEGMDERMRPQRD